MQTVPYAQPTGYGAPQRRVPNQGYVRQGQGRPKKESTCCASFNSILSTLVMIGILAGAGVYLFLFDGLAQLQALFGFGGSTSAPFAFPTPPPVPTVPTPPTGSPTRQPTVLRAGAGADPFIEVIFAGVTQPTSIQNAFTDAAATWSSVLDGHFITPAPFPPSATFESEGCKLPPTPTPTTPSNNPPIGTLLTDHLIIGVVFSPIDGPSGTLASAGPCKVTPTGDPTVEHPYLGRMTFDTADVGDADADGSLVNIVLHEMGHVLGIGTLWDFPAFVPSVLENPVFATGAPPGTPGTPGNQPLFIGHSAMQEYQALGAANGSKIPVEDGAIFAAPAFGGNPPSTISAGQGGGSIDGHWKESVFNNELMTPLIGAAPAPLSLMTIRSLEDIGYAVNVASAEGYTLGASSRDEANPQALKQDEHFYDMTGDIRYPDQLTEVQEENLRRRLRARAPEPGPSRLN